MMPLSTAMKETGAAQLVAERLVRLVGDAGPHRAAGRTVPADGHPGPADQQYRHGPDRHSDRRRGRDRASGVSPRPVLMSVAVAAAASFLTPDRDPDQPDGDGAGRLPIRRLLEARPAVADLVFPVGTLFVPLIWRF